MLGSLGVEGPLVNHRLVEPVGWREAFRLWIHEQVVRELTNGKVLSAVEVHLLPVLVLHRQVIATNLDLVKLVQVDDHLSLGFPQQALDVLRVQLLRSILVLRRHRFLRLNAIESRVEATGVGLAIKIKPDVFQIDTMFLHFAVLVLVPALR